ncbi:MAG: hypothetical protein EXR72_05690 [Myxococcales bacterium]|nr:hypothetical protein [Myxococcales bacterium]
MASTTEVVVPPTSPTHEAEDRHPHRCATERTVENYAAPLGGGADGGGGKPTRQRKQRKVLLRRRRRGP